MALDQTSASRYLVPLGTLVALAVAIGVWLVPSSVLDPSPPDVGEVRAAIPDAPVVEHQEVPDAKAWMDVAQELESLREPDEVKEPPKEEGGDRPPRKEDGTGGDKPPPPRYTVNWEYEGCVEQPDRIAALIRVAGIQRFVFEGEPVNDNSLPPGTTAVISEVTPDHIVVSIDGGEQTIERTNDAPPVRAPTTPRRSPNRTAPGRRRS
jgi:hypothetical protein